MNGGFSDKNALFESFGNYLGKPITTNEEFGNAYASDLANLYADSEDYTSSVNANGGFYIGRYEYTWSGTVANDLVKRFFQVIDPLNIAKSYNDHASLLTGAAWDRVLDWIVEEDNGISLSDILVNSENWGGYYDYYIEDGYWSATSWGSKANNIYDIAGNIGEITTEIFYDNYIVRGGSIEKRVPAASRYDTYDYDSNYGLRIALYL